MPRLYIAIHRPQYGNYKHWGLYLTSPGQDTVYEVTGEHGTFKAKQIDSVPQNSTRHIKNIPVGEVNEQDLPALQGIVGKAKVDNETLEWNCQDYVLEILEKLCEECIIDGDHKTYKKGTKEAKDKYFGPG